jgi:hypothetical protein
VSPTTCRPAGPSPGEGPSHPLSRPNAASERRWLALQPALNFRDSARLTLPVMKKQKPKLHTIAVNIPPYGRMRIVGEAGENALSAFQRNWPRLWPKVKRNLKSMLRRYNDSFEVPIRLTGQKWLGEGARLDPDVFMGDQAELYLRVQFEEPSDWEDPFPVWDFFIKETTVVHCQPVF